MSSIFNPTSAVNVEVDLGSTAAWRGRFTITDASISTSSKLLVWQAPGPYTGKGTRADEAEMQPVNVIAVSSASGSASVFWETPTVYVSVYERAYHAQIPIGAGFPLDLKDYSERSKYITVRRGVVRGNVKFNYVIFG